MGEDVITGLTLSDVYGMGEDNAYALFRTLRWPETEGEAICPRCGCLDTYDISSRRRFKCAGCYHQFSVTSGTIFASRKLSFVDLLAVLVGSRQQGSMLQLSRDVAVQYRTAFYLSRRIRNSGGQQWANL